VPQRYPVTKTLALNPFVFAPLTLVNCLDHAAAPGSLEEYLFEISFGMSGLLVFVSSDATDAADRSQTF